MGRKIHFAGLSVALLLASASAWANVPGMAPGVRPDAVFCEQHGEVPGTAAFEQCLKAKMQEQAPQTLSSKKFQATRNALGSINGNNMMKDLASRDPKMAAEIQQKMAAEENKLRQEYGKKTQQGEQ